MSYIPENLRYYIRKDKSGYRPFFPVDSTNEKTNETAKRWAYSDYEVIERPNDPIENVQLVDLEVRSEGGRAYKVVIGDLLCDMREDTLLDTIKEVGISPCGYLNGKYIWAMSGSQMKLIRFGSAAHNEFMTATERRALPRIRKFEVGHIYATQGGERWTYIGRVNTLSGVVTQYRDHYTPNLITRIRDFEKIKGAHLFRYKWNYGATSYYIVKSKTFVEDCGIEDVPTIEECRPPRPDKLDYVAIDLHCMVQYNQEVIIPDWLGPLLDENNFKF